jgi:hypothetical protein
MRKSTIGDGAAAACEVAEDAADEAAEAAELPVAVIEDRWLLALDKSLVMTEETLLTSELINGPPSELADESEAVRELTEDAIDAL